MILCSTHLIVLQLPRIESKEEGRDTIMRVIGAMIMRDREELSISR